jgi:midasin (ATPase involved in ribosome maturation)
MIESTAQSVSSIDNALITFAPQPAPENASPLYLSAQDLNAFVVDIGGILLPKKRMVASTSSVIDALVPVSSSARALRAIALACCRGGPVLVTGPPGSGKSTLLSEVARLTGNSDLIHIHLDDQIDSKVRHPKELFDSLHFAHV